MGLAVVVDWLWSVKKLVHGDRSLWSRSLNKSWSLENFQGYDSLYFLTVSFKLCFVWMMMPMQIDESFVVGTGKMIYNDIEKKRRSRW